MPKVNGKKYPYTKSGKKAAAKARKKKKRKSSMSRHTMGMIK